MTEEELKKGLIDIWEKSKMEKIQIVMSKRNAFLFNTELKIQMFITEPRKLAKEYRKIRNKYYLLNEKYIKLKLEYDGFKKRNKGEEKIS
jgi:hypothetical protein